MSASRWAALGPPLLRECSGLICAESWPVPCIACCSHQDDRWLEGEEGTRFKTRTLHHSGLMLGSTAPVGRICRTKLTQNHISRTAGLGPPEPNIAHPVVSGAGKKEKKKKKTRRIWSGYASTCSSPVFQNAVAANCFCCSTNSFVIP